MVGVVGEYVKETIGGSVLNSPITNFRKKRDLGLLGVRPLDTLSLIPRDTNPEEHVFTALKSNSTSNVQCKKKRLKNYIPSPRSWNLRRSERRRENPCAGGGDPYSFFGNDLEENYSPQNNCFSHLIRNRKKSSSSKTTRLRDTGIGSCLRPLKKGMKDEPTSSICTSECSIDAPLLFDMEDFEKRVLKRTECEKVLQVQNNNIPRIKNEREDVMKRIKGILEKRLPSTVFVELSESLYAFHSNEDSLDEAKTSMGTSELSDSTQSELLHDRWEPSHGSNPYSHLQNITFYDKQGSKSSSSIEDTTTSLSMIDFSLPSGMDGSVVSSSSDIPQRSSGISTIKSSEFDVTRRNSSSISSDTIEKSVEDSSDVEHFPQDNKEEIGWSDQSSEDSSEFSQSPYEEDSLKFLFTPTHGTVDSDIEAAFPLNSLEYKAKIYAKDAELDSILDNTSVQTDERSEPNGKLQNDGETLSPKSTNTTHLVQRIVKSEEESNPKIVTKGAIREGSYCTNVVKNEPQQCIESYGKALYLTFENCIENSISDDESLTTEDLYRIKRLAELNRSFYASYNPRKVRLRSIQWWDEDPHTYDCVNNPISRLAEKFKQICSCQDLGVPVGKEIIFEEQHELCSGKEASASISQASSSEIGDSMTDEGLLDN